MFKIGDNVTATCEINDKHNGTVIAYVAGTDGNGEREYWCDVVGFGMTVWPESALAPRGAK